MTVEPASYDDQHLETGIILRCLPRQICHRMSPYSFYSLGIQVALQCLFAGLLGQKARQVITFSGLVVLCIINVLLGLLQPTLALFSRIRSHRALSPLAKPVV